MNKDRIILACLTIFLAASAWAEDIKAPVSKSGPPFYKIPPPGSSWTVNITYSKPTQQDDAGAQELAAPTPPPESGVSLPTKIEKTFGANRIQKVTTTYSDGKKTDYYVLGSVMLQKYSGSDKVAVLPAVPIFPGVDWTADGGAMVGTQTIDDIECYKIKITESYLSAIPWPLDTQYYAWIDIITKYPLQAQNNEILYKFSPITTGAGSVVLPPEYQDAANQALVQSRMSESFRRLNRR